MYKEKPPAIKKRGGKRNSINFDGRSMLPCDVENPPLFQKQELIIKEEGREKGSCKRYNEMSNSKKRNEKERQREREKKLFH